MSGPSLRGCGVLVTRPAHQAGKLITAIERHGGTAVGFPAIDIEPRDAAAMAAELAALPPADIVIFVSSNAVACGFRPDTVGTARVAVIGPATHAAITHLGGTVDIVSCSGFDSEHLLCAPALKDVAGRCVRIVRGEHGRELLADTLRQRGARVDYLSVYARRPHRHTEEQLQRLTTRWRAGKINSAIVMSVETLHNLLEVLPPACHELLAATPLVTPSKRVIQTASRLLPGIPTTLSSGPRTDDLIQALVSGTEQRLRQQ